MSALQSYRAAINAMRKASEFIALIGKPQTHTTARGCYGKITGIKICTTVHYQAYDGANNYHTCEEFDDALAEVVKERFGDLRDAAIGKLIDKADGAKAAAADEYRHLFNEEIT